MANYMEWECPACGHEITGESSEVLEDAFDHGMECDER